MDYPSAIANLTLGTNGQCVTRVLHWNIPPAVIRPKQMLSLVLAGTWQYIFYFQVGSGLTFYNIELKQPWIWTSDLECKDPLVVEIQWHHVSNFALKMSVMNKNIPYKNVETHFSQNDVIWCFGCWQILHWNGIEYKGNLHHFNIRFRDL